MFLSNFHFEATGTNYLSSFLPPSPLQNFWSLSVEEQFYLVFPLLLVVIVKVKGRSSFRVRLATVLSLIVVASFTLSVVQTSASPTVAFFSPFTRAWELALGALIALGTGRLLRVSAPIATVVTWSGLALILTAAFTLTAQSSYPGYLVALPVVGAGLIVAGGTAVPRCGVEALLSRSPFRLLGKVSYSFYLWHWPILILAAESSGQTSLPAPRSLLWVALALVVSIGSYLFVENPVRHARSLVGTPWASIGIGALVTLVVLGILTVELGSHGATAVQQQVNSSGRPASSEAVGQLVAASDTIEQAPPNLTPSPGAAFFDFGIPSSWAGCSASYSQVKIPACTFGDAEGTHTVVLYGDSHALMWAQAMNDIAIRAKWRFVLLEKSGCPAVDLSVQYPKSLRAPSGEWSACDRCIKQQ